MLARLKIGFKRTLSALIALKRAVANIKTFSYSRQGNLGRLNYRPIKMLYFWNGNLKGQYRLFRTFVEQSKLFKNELCPVFMLI